MRRLYELSYRLNDTARLIVDARTTSKLAGIVIGEYFTIRIKPKPIFGNEAVDILAMVQNLDTLKVIALTKDLKAYRARRDERSNLMAAEQVGIICHHLACCICLARKHKRTTTTHTTIPICIPYALANSCKYLIHRALHSGRKLSHTTCKIAYTATPRGAIEIVQIAISTLIGDVTTLGTRVKTQRIKIDTHGAFCLATATHQAVIGNLELKHIIASVTQKVDRLNIVNTEVGLKLAGVDAYTTT
jgi:hypothetical protein